MLHKILTFFNVTWKKFLALKKWQQIVIIFLLILVLIPSTSELEQSSSESENNVAEQAQTPTHSTKVDISPSPAPSKTPDSEIEFRFAALRDLEDMRKDINDARIGITQNGLGKFYWNVAEINMNLSQLDILVPRNDYALDWNKKLQILKTSVDDLSNQDDNLTISKAKLKLNKVYNAIPALENIARSLAN